MSGRFVSLFLRGRMLALLKREPTLPKEFHFSLSFWSESFSDHGCVTALAPGWGCFAFMCPAYGNDPGTVPMQVLPTPRAPPAQCRKEVSGALSPPTKNDQVQSGRSSFGKPQRPSSSPLCKPTVPCLSGPLHLLVRSA